MFRPLFNLQGTVSCVVQSYSEPNVLYYITSACVCQGGFWNFFQLFQSVKFRFPLISACFYEQQSVLLLPSVSGWRSAQRRLLYHIVRRLSRGFGNFFRFSFQETVLCFKPIGFRHAD